MKKSLINMSQEMFLEHFTAVMFQVEVFWDAVSTLHSITTHPRSQETQPGPLEHEGGMLSFSRLKVG
jgi:hypothetical protein